MSSNFGLSSLSRVFSESDQEVRFRVIAIYTFLVSFNVIAWLLAFILFGQSPALLLLALTAYTFGLRHAFDADHISAIDNVTRKLMQENKRPVAVGFFFSFGHSTIVVLLTFSNL
jgi:nickel/cobalt transporter (NiCoT) family protein